MRKSFIALTTIAGMFLQAVPVFALDSLPPSVDFFENAWQEAAASQAYTLTCAVSSTSIKTKKGATLTSDQKKLVDLSLSALKKFKRTTVGTFLGENKRLYTSLATVNTLGILDSMAAKEFTMDEAVQKMKVAKNKKVEIFIDGNSVYYKADGKWKVYEDPDFVATVYGSASTEPLTMPLEKDSFVFKNYTGSDKSSSSIYQGTLTAAETVSLMKPFMTEDTAKKQVLSSTKLLITPDGHLQKYDVLGKVTLGGLSFTVKEQCNLKLKNVKIALPLNATVIDLESGKKELGGMVLAL